MKNLMRTHLVAVACLLSLTAPTFADDVTSIEQIGTGHSATAQQQQLAPGAENSAAVRQEGTGNTASVNQQSPVLDRKSVV